MYSKVWSVEDIKSGVVYQSGGESSRVRDYVEGIQGQMLECWRRENRKAFTCASIQNSILYIM